MKLLAREGCTIIQSYYFGKPEPGSAIRTAPRWPALEAKLACLNEASAPRRWHRPPGQRIPAAKRITFFSFAAAVWTGAHAPCTIGGTRQEEEGRLTMRPYWMLACALVTPLAGCAKAGGPGSMSENCAALKRQQTAMVAEGRQNTDAYRRILDAYLARCHR